MAKPKPIWWPRRPNPFLVVVAFTVPAIIILYRYSTGLHTVYFKGPIVSSDLIATVGPPLQIGGGWASTVRFRQGCQVPRRYTDSLPNDLTRTTFSQTNLDMVSCFLRGAQRRRPHGRLQYVTLQGHPRGSQTRSFYRLGRMVLMEE